LIVDRYLERVGLDGSDTSLETLCRAHVQSIPYENLDVRLGREIRLDVDSLVAKLVDARRGGYCYEHNTLFAAVLEELGYSVTRLLARVRMGDVVSPRPATHMVLRVDDQIVDVGFGSAVPLGPVPFDGEATYGAWTWRSSRTTSPEGEDVWKVSLLDLPMFTFADRAAHPVDYIAPNHFSSTHPLSIFTQFVIATRWREDGVQIGLNGCTFKERRPDWSEHDTEIDPADLGSVLSEHFGIDLPGQDLVALSHLLGG
jgi:N-hydroxyarylamine O-acetyltransferase